MGRCVDAVTWKWHPPALDFGPCWMKIEPAIFSQESRP